MENAYVWINRFGIIFNFIAGFLLAPELIGSKRLKKWENRIENSISNIAPSFRKFVNSVWEYASIMLVFIALILIAIAISSVFFRDRLALFFTQFYAKAQTELIIERNTSSIIGSLRNEALSIRDESPFVLAINGFLLLASYITPIILFNRHATGNTIVKLVKLLKSIAIVTLIFIVLAVLSFVLLKIFFFETLFILFAFFLVWFLTLACLPLFRFILTRLAGEDKLRSNLMAIGVFFFIIGNLLQLIAA
jgi:hypothetical protein